MTKKININLNKFNKQIQEAFDDMVDIQSQAFDDAITAEVWDWDDITVRKNGDIVSSPRDIVDTEELLDSKVIIRKDLSVEFDWEAPHAAIVHEGATTKNGGQIPARPWTQYALSQSDPKEVLETQIKKRTR